MSSSSSSVGSHQSIYGLRNGLIDGATVAGKSLGLSSFNTLHKFGAIAKTGKAHTNTHWKMKSYIIYTFIFNGTKWFRNELCTPTRLQFMRSTEMKFKILLSLFSRLSPYCQRFYPVSSAAIAKGHKYNTRTLTHTKTHSVFMAWFYWFPSYISWQWLRLAIISLRTPFM